MVADLQRDGLREHPLVGGVGGIIIVQTPIRRIVPVHGVPRRPERRVIGPQIDLPVTHRIERPGLREGLSRGILQKRIAAYRVFPVGRLVLVFKDDRDRYIIRYVVRILLLPSSHVV